MLFEQLKKYFVRKVFQGKKHTKLKLSPVRVCVARTNRKNDYWDNRYCKNECRRLYNFYED